MRFDFGAVVLAPFPFTNQTDLKQRPAVIISNRAYNAAKPDAMMMAITTKLRPSPELAEVRLDQWQAAGLLYASTVRPVFFMIEQSLIIRQLGSLVADDQTALKKAIGDILG